VVVKRRIERTTRGSSTSMNTRYKVESTMYGTMRRSMLGAVNERERTGEGKHAVADRLQDHQDIIQEELVYVNLVPR